LPFQTCESERAGQCVDLAAGGTGRFDDHGKGIVVQRTSEDYGIGTILLDRQAKPPEALLPEVEWRLLRVKRASQGEFPSVAKSGVLQGTEVVFGTADEKGSSSSRANRPESANDKVNEVALTNERTADHRGEKYKARQRQGRKVRPEIPPEG
jgi:hypothetical protein